ncbi:MAG: efflux transporter outer membrane subunit [Planctomycetes bacterium]|nr:efflux transporter outer membrane subunit [Planctomycetota bacterium]
MRAHGLRTQGGCARAPRRLASLAATSLVLFAGCVVGPDYTAPELDAPAAWSAPIEDGVRPEGDPARLAAWWESLGDPQLTDLVERAAAGNLDLSQALSRLRRARALRGLAGAERWPEVDLDTSVTRRETSDNVGVDGRTSTLYAAGLDASWELDLFGGLRRSVEAAEASLAAAREDVRDVLVSVTAEVALTYVDLRTAQERLRIARSNLEAQQQTLELLDSIVEAGLRDERDLEQARANVKSTEATLPTLQTAVSRAAHRLAVLSGETPDTLLCELETPAPIPVGPVEIAVGVPAEALRRRPDVRAAERRLAAETARIGVEQAGAYPELSLSGSIGFESFSTGNLFDVASRVFHIGPTLGWDVFDAGRVRDRVAAQSAVRDEAFSAYEAVVLAALEEVENALVGYVQEQLRRDALSEATEAARSSLALATDQYGAGIVDFVVVLDAQRTLLSLEDQLATSEGAITSELVRLYKALGGGWERLDPVAR